VNSCKNIVLVLVVTTPFFFFASLHLPFLIIKQRGGGLYITGPATIVTMIACTISRNTASSDQNGVSGSLASEFLQKHRPRSRCHHRPLPIFRFFAFSIFIQQTARLYLLQFLVFHFHLSKRKWSSNTALGLPLPLASPPSCPLFLFFRSRFYFFKT